MKSYLLSFTEPRYFFCYSELNIETVCADITVVTQAWGYENSWTFGSCSSSQTYGSYQEYTEECCQPAGSYDLTCTCSYGDGWHGGYIQIGDSFHYCADFTSGYASTVEDIAYGGGNEIPPQGMNEELSFIFSQSLTIFSVILK